MKITKAIELAQKHIRVAYAGGYYVAEPYYGITQCDGPANAPTSTTDWHKAKSECRVRRIEEVVGAVTGDSEYAEGCGYEQLCNGARFEDWRSDARRYVSAYKGAAK